MPKFQAQGIYPGVIKAEDHNHNDLLIKEFEKFPLRRSQAFHYVAALLP